MLLNRLLPFFSPCCHLRQIGGKIITYVRNSRGLELSRTEASGTPQERTIVTQWHPQFRLPTKITEPNKITEYTYDVQGHQLSRGVQSAQ